ncbi:transposable element Tcb2 transposase [Trichonephila clavipes]|nr:transposable element Tcb2 transposase [Trichonephila clavipes]
MSICRYQRHYKHLSGFERGRISGVLEAEWSAWRVAHQKGCSDLTVRRFGDQWTEETSFTWRSGSRRTRQTSRQDYRHIIRHVRVEPTTSLTAVLKQEKLLLRAPVSSRTIAWCLAEGHLVSRRPLRVLPMTPTHRRLHLEWCLARRDWTAKE